MGQPAAPCVLVVVAAWVRRATPSDAWGSPQPLSELNTTGAEGDPWLSPDERVIVFARNNAIYTTTR